ncbi:Plectin [Eumeta japonica]|uniref:Plectin n=1 Tax=Eumeta variegata TaxID=151549 RepID=A0A4C1U427_EUMVA|nr:Plectin [Eumeta japonica]
MSMYRFVKEGGSKRLFVQGTLEGDGDPHSRPLKSSLKKSNQPVGSPITTSLNLASVPRSLREGLTRTETVYDGNYPGAERSYRASSYRGESYNGRVVHDGGQTHFEYDARPTEGVLAVPTSAGGHGVSELQAIHTNKRMSTEVLGSSLESTKISKKDDSGQRRITTRIVRKVTTLTRGEEKASTEDLTRRGDAREVHRSSEHYRHIEMEATHPKKVKISDIVAGNESNVTAREALLSWARRSTAKYPGVRVTDFTSSWRDGLAFNALIHRNRPDLIDWRNIRSRQVRERLETAFHVVEKEYGVTRLLDPEDVDTHEPDEKSLITYISSLYETFPEPAPVHPLFDAESQRRAAAYTEQAAAHRAWLHENCALMQDRAFPSTLIEMKKLLSESTRFRSEEVPARQRDKQKLFHQYRELEKYFETVGECDIEPTLRPEALEQAWSRLLMAQQERERDLADEIRRLERLQRLAEKLHRDIKQMESSLESVERRIDSEIRRVERGVHPADAKMAAEQIEQDLRAMEHGIQEMFQDSHALREGRYPQANDLHRRVQQLHDRWLAARQAFTGRLLPRLSSVRMPVQQTTVRRETRTVLETRVHDADPRFQMLHDATRWCKEKLKKLHESEYGSDLPSVQHEIERHQREHKQIDQFDAKVRVERSCIDVEQCVNNRGNLSGEDLNLYNQHLSQLQKLYTELLTTSTKRGSDLDTLHEFLQSATAELNWLNEKEQIELSRDWADPQINLPSIQHYYEQLMSSLEKRELQFSNVIDRGEALIAQHHPAAKTIEAHLQVMQSQWAWVLQLTLCLETHLKHTTQYHNYFEEIKKAEKWIAKCEESLNTTFSQSEFTLDQGERLLKGTQELREELNANGPTISRLVEEAQDIRPLKQRRQPITRPIRAETVCAYKHANVAIEKGSQVMVVDNSGRSRWRVRLGGAGSEAQLPGAVLALPPPCPDALDAASRLRNAYDRVIQLWQRKNLRMRQNMIFATIKVVKGWDFPQFLAMGAEQRQAIRRALNEDAEKLLAEGDPADPQLRRLRREIDDVNRLFDEFERRARAEEESKNAARIFTEQSSNLLERLEVLERQLHERVANHIPRDLDSLEHLVLQHKDWESSLHALSDDVEEVQSTFRGIALKTPAMKKNLDKVMGKWKELHSKSQLFVERLKVVEIIVNILEENNQSISEFEIKLAQFSDLPNDVDLLKDMHEDLLRMQVAASKQQSQIDQMTYYAENCRHLVESSRSALPHSSLPRAGKHIDLERLDKDVAQLISRWNNVVTQIAERLRSCEAAYQLLKNYSSGLEKEAEWIDDTFSKLQAQPPIEVRPKEQFEPTRNLLNTVVERTPKIEKVNADGGRFIREAKIQSSRCQRYTEWLCEEIHPSLDMRQLRRQAEVEAAERLRARGRAVPERPQTGADAVAKELDQLNANHQRLLDLLYERLRRIAAASPGDIVTLYNARNSAAVELVTKASQWRKIDMRGRKEKGRGVLNLRITRFVGKLESGKRSALHCQLRLTPPTARGLRLMQCFSLYRRNLDASDIEKWLSRYPCRFHCGQYVVLISQRANEQATSYQRAKWSLSSMDIYKPRRVMRALSTFWEGIGYLMEGDRASLARETERSVLAPDPSRRSRLIAAAVRRIV